MATARERFIGRTANRIVASAPWAWPLLRGPLRRFFDDRAPGWDERTGAGSPEHLAPLAAAALLVRPAPERILDIGCGTGEGALFLAREFATASVRGVDISEQMIREARHKVGLDPEGRIAFKVADAEDLPWPEDSFDLVALLNMPPFFAEIARVLRPGGHVIVAASWGDRTPFYTPEKVLRRQFDRHGVETIRFGATGEGTFYVGCGSRVGEA